MKKLIMVLAAIVLLLLAAVAVAAVAPRWMAPRMELEVDVKDPELIRQGEYLARVADCGACHTAPGGKPFAGGLGMQTPMGAIYSTNITPDARTGIGEYDFADFERAVRRGVRRDGKALYPAMPFVSYMIASDDEIKAMYAYFMSAVEPVEQTNPAATIPWPANMRWPLAWWQMFFARNRSFEPDPSLDPVAQRGAYLVEGLAHCGACHTPRGIGFQEKALKDDASGVYLSGSVLEGWYAKNLRNEGLGLATWTEDEVHEFLRSGRTDRTAAFGGMADVVEHSTQHMSDEDLRAMARYLKQLPARKGRSETWEPREDTTTARLRAGDYSERGALGYVEYCAYCHRNDGRGAPRIYPALAGNSIVFAEDPSSLIQVTLAGGRMAETRHDVMTFAMPGYTHVNNEELAEIITFIRNAWGNHGSEVKPVDIARMRRVIANKPRHHVPGVQVEEEQAP
ncbi:c-type cytochrome [Luteimonas sp. e5]